MFTLVEFTSHHILTWEKKLNFPNHMWEYIEVHEGPLAMSEGHRAVKFNVNYLCYGNKIIESLKPLNGPSGRLLQQNLFWFVIWL